MKNYISFLLLLFISGTAFSQATFFYISGKVIDKNTKLPLQGASVFAQNTTMGTATDDAGNFKLALPNGGYELVVTFTGYETEVKRISTADATDNNIVIEIRQKEKELESVAIVSSNEVKDGWAKYGNFFTENFIGKTINGRQCTLLNPEVLKFYFSKKKNRLKVTATAPIEIQNEALGYKIKYTLDSFTHEYSTEVSLYSGYPLFEELPLAGDAQKENRDKNRLKAYNGSMLHFMRSIYGKTLKENSFEIQYLIKNNDTESAFPLKNFYTALNYSWDDSTQTVEITPNQPNLAILYSGEKPDEEYLAQTGDTLKQFQLSILAIAPQKSIVIEQNGYYFDQNDLTINGYWTWEKVGDMLPYDFKPL